MWYKVSGRLQAHNCIGCLSMVQHLAFFFFCSSLHSRLIWWRQRLLSIQRLSWCGAKRSTRTRAITTTSGHASAPPPPVHVLSGKLFGGRSPPKVSGIPIYGSVCCSYPQVRWAWACCCPGHWKQESPPHGAGSFPEHSLQPVCLSKPALNT